MFCAWREEGRRGKGISHYETRWKEEGNSATEAVERGK